MGRWKRGSAQPQLPTTIVVPGFHDGDDDSDDDFEDWEGYPEPVQQPRQSKVKKSEDAAVARSSYTVGSTEMRVEMPLDADSDDDVDGGGRATGPTPTPPPKRTVIETKKVDPSQTYAALDEDAAMKLVLPKRALMDPFASAADPFTQPAVGPDPFATSTGPVSARQRGAVVHKAGSNSVGPQGATAVGTVCGHSRALRGDIPLDVQQKADDWPAEFDFNPKLVAAAASAAPAATGADGAADPFGTPVKSVARQGQGLFDAFGQGTMDESSA
mmetsp:Transcript_19664/g.51156  ORF Transcript_19664/g.51156 Transcript_19664/m.51156 type:complete len:272 (+) Transcript_19664:267-1082(+)